MSENVMFFSDKSFFLFAVGDLECLCGDFLWLLGHLNLLIYNKYRICIGTRIIIGNSIKHTIVPLTLVVLLIVARDNLC